MDTKEEPSSAQIFAEYHRSNRGRAIKPILVLAGIAVVIGSFVGGLTLFTQSQAPADAAASTSAPEGPLTVENFAEVTSAAATSAGSGHLTMSVTAAGATVTLDGDFQNGTTVADSLLSYKITLTPESSLELRVVGGIFYANLGAATEGKFVALDPNDPSNPLAAQLTSLVDQANAVSTSGLQDAITSVEVDGEPELIDGVQATPYRVVIKTAGLESTLALSAEEQAALPAEFTYLYLIGPDNLIRKVTFEVSGVKQEITFSKWGDPVTVLTPTADELTSIPAG